MLDMCEGSEHVMSAMWHVEDNELLHKASDCYKHNVLLHSQGWPQ